MPASPFERVPAQHHLHAHQNEGLLWRPSCAARLAKPAAGLIGSALSEGHNRCRLPLQNSLGRISATLRPKRFVELAKATVAKPSRQGLPRLPPLPAPTQHAF